MKNYIKYIAIAIIIFSWGLNSPYCQYYRCDSFNNFCDVSCYDFYRGYCSAEKYYTDLLCIQSFVLISTAVMLFMQDIKNTRYYKVVLNKYEQLKIQYIRENCLQENTKLYREAICYAADCIYNSDCYTTDQKKYINRKSLLDIKNI